jgi:hypothetical protein
MCFPRRRHDPKSRRLYIAGLFCLASSPVPLLFYEHGFGHRHPAIVDGLRFLLLGCAFGLLLWSARRSAGCTPRP